MEELSKRDLVQKIALYEANMYGVVVTTITGAATVAASYKSKNFNKFTQISTKVSLPVMAGLFTWGLKYELVTNSATRQPHLWGINKSSVGENMKKVKAESLKMPFHHTVINTLYDNPFNLVMALGFPFAGYILKENLKLKHLTLSQKFMHSRVMAQMGVLGILFSTMIFKAYMDKHGRFQDPAEVNTNPENKKLPLYQQ